MLKIATFIPAAMLAFAVTTVHAQPSSAPAKGQPDPARFAEHKQKVLARIQTHMQTLQTLQSCVQAANDQTAIKACEEAAHANMPRRHDGEQRPRGMKNM